MNVLEPSRPALDRSSWTITRQGRGDECVLPVLRSRLDLEVGIALTPWASARVQVGTFARPVMAPIPGCGRQLLDAEIVDTAEAIRIAWHWPRAA